MLWHGHRSGHLGARISWMAIFYSGQSWKPALTSRSNWPWQHKLIKRLVLWNFWLPCQVGWVVKHSRVRLGTSVAWSPVSGDPFLSSYQNHRLWYWECHDYWLREEGLSEPCPWSLYTVVWVLKKQNVVLKKNGAAEAEFSLSGYSRQQWCWVKGFGDVMNGEGDRTQHQPGRLGKLCSWPFPDCH